MLIRLSKTWAWAISRAVKSEMPSVRSYLVESERGAPSESNLSLILLSSCSMSQLRVSTPLRLSVFACCFRGLPARKARLSSARSTHPLLRPSSTSTNSFLCAMATLYTKVTPKIPSSTSSNAKCPCQSSPTLLTTS